MTKLEKNRQSIISIIEDYLLWYQGDSDDTGIAEEFLDSQEDDWINGFFENNILDKEQLRDIMKKKVEQGLIDRDRSGALKDECDYLVGAMTVLAHINVLIYNTPVKESMGIVPPMWMLGPMSGRSVLEELKNLEKLK